MVNGADDYVVRAVGRFSRVGEIVDRLKIASFGARG